MIIKKYRIQYGKGFEAQKLGKWQRVKTGVGKVGRGIAKVPKTVVVATGATAVALPKAAIAGTFTGIGSTLYSPVRLTKAVGKTLYHGTKGLSREAKRFIAWRKYKSAKAKLKALPENIELQKQKNNLYAKLKASTGRVYETRKQIGKSLFNGATEITGTRVLSNVIKGSVESLKKTAKYTGKHFDIPGRDTLKTLKPISTANIIYRNSSSNKKLPVNLAHNSNQKKTPEDYLKSERLQKQITKIKAIMKTEKYEAIYNEYKYKNNNNVSKKLGEIETSINSLITKIPTLNMFDPNRAQLQKEYENNRELFKILKVMKFVRENSNLFSNQT